MEQSHAEGHCSHAIGLSNTLSSSDYKQYQQAHKLDKLSEALEDIAKAASIAGISIQEALAALESFYKLAATQINLLNL